MKHLLIIALCFTIVFGNPWSPRPQQSISNSKPTQAHQGQVWRPQPQAQCNPGWQPQHQQRPNPPQKPVSSIWQNQLQQGFRPQPNQNLIKPGDFWPTRPSNNGWGRPVTSNPEWQPRPRPNPHHYQRPLVDVPYTVEITNHPPQQLNNNQGWKQQINSGWTR